MTPLTRIVVIGASAGGVQALQALVRALPADLDAAYLVVLHIPAHTTSSLPQILQRATQLPVRAADEGEQLRAGHIYVAPADRHMMLEGGAIRLTRGPKECRVRPAIDALFRSASVEFGPRVIGILLSGSLDDGTAGMWAIKDRGGVALVQDPATADYPSMPHSASLHVEIDGVHDLQGLALAVAQLVQASPPAASIDPPSTSLQIENLIAAEGNGLRAGVMELGPVSRYTCPDCHGVLVEIKNGPIVRFRCHTGHAFSIGTLLDEVNEAIDTGLWDALRAVEERVMLLQQMEQQLRTTGNAEAADLLANQMRHASRGAEQLRGLALNPKLFGHTPKDA